MNNIVDMTGLLPPLTRINKIWFSNKCAKNTKFTPTDSCEALYLHGNQILKIPEYGFSELKKLEELYLDWNNLTSIDENSLGGLDNLKIFQASRNKLSYKLIKKCSRGSCSIFVYKFGTSIQRYEHLRGFLHLKKDSWFLAHFSKFFEILFLNFFNRFFQISNDAFKHTTGISSLEMWVH